MSMKTSDLRKSNCLPAVPTVPEYSAPRINDVVYPPHFQNLEAFKKHYLEIISNLQKK